ncbi:hypothetical protein GGR57DRAFT_498053 [Xylariaceae sp. FL1272]|nr:hypothetical protein GGR57DRAFT_498053 [Xylariaceae sp. FL1272]
MDSPIVFHLFPELPPELRHIIWEFAILEHNRDRLVPFTQSSKRIMAICNLAFPHLRTTTESRHVALRLYPVNMPIVSLVRTQDAGHSLTVDDSFRTYALISGRVRLNFDLDIFALCMGRLHRGVHIITNSNDAPSAIRTNFGWRTTSLQLSQCAEIKRFLVFDTYDERVPVDVCNRPGCLREGDSTTAWTKIYQSDLDTARRWPWNKPEMFGGVQEIMYGITPKKDAEEMYLELLGVAGQSMVKTLEQHGRLAKFDLLELKELRTAPACVCAKYVPHSLRVMREQVPPQTKTRRTDEPAQEAGHRA